MTNAPAWTRILRKKDQTTLDDLNEDEKTNV